MKRGILIILCLLLTLNIAAAETLSGYDIAKKCYDVDDGDDIRAVTIMEITRPDGRTIKRNFDTFRKDFGDDDRALAIFKAPEDVKGTSFLSWMNRDRDNDQWLYMPALRKITRISSSNKNASFMGSDFSYEEVDKRPLNKDDFKLLREEQFDGNDCYVLEFTAKDKEETFPKRIAWVKKDNFISVKVESYDSSGNLAKVFTVSRLKEIDGVWTVLSCKMEDLRTKGYTTMELSNVKYNTGLSDRMFQKESLGR
ncbi:MAG: outer membrane lipoprotein-sorting protein [Desulfobacterales bacterium]|nr:outer membrane lipoprotein-sorting protein [Desulfobacterales bacterium]